MLAVTGAVLMLAGCAAPPPPPSDPEGIRALVVAGESRMWDSEFGPEPEPVIEVERWVDDAGAQYDAVTARVDELAPAETELRRVQWECMKRFPLDPASPDLAFVLTHEQRGYLYDYYIARLIPCLEAIGMTIGSVPPRSSYVDGPYRITAWSPYRVMMPAPERIADWEAIDAACPPPPYAHQIHPYPDPLR